MKKKKKNDFFRFFFSIRKDYSFHASVDFFIFKKIKKEEKKNKLCADLPLQQPQQTPLQRNP